MHSMMNFLPTLIITQSVLTIKKKIVSIAVDSSTSSITWHKHAHKYNTTILYQYSCKKKWKRVELFSIDPACSPRYCIDHGATHSTVQYLLLTSRSID